MIPNHSVTVTLYDTVHYYPCLCPREFTHDVSKLTPKDISVYVKADHRLPEYTSVIIEKHKAYLGVSGWKFLYNCTCEVNEDHWMGILDKHEIGKHISIDGVKVEESN